MAAVEPIPDTPAALATSDSERLLVFADFHAGIEHQFRQNGVEIPSRAEDRRAAVRELVARTDPTGVVILGDLGTDIGRPRSSERRELEQLFATVTEHVPLTIVKGNHDGDIESIVPTRTTDHAISVTDSSGCRYGDIGFVHGHTWPTVEVLEGSVLVMGHEHPEVRLTDTVGGARTERVWLRGTVDPEPFETHHDVALSDPGDLIVCPAFNELTGGTWINTEQPFLSPFLPAGITDGQAYLLDGTRLGPYQNV